MDVINNAPGAPAPIGAYSQAIDTGSLLFCSGQIGIDPTTGELVSDSVEDQVRQVLQNIGAVLRFAGSHWDKVTMTTIFLADLNDAPVVNQAYSEVVSSLSPPARQTVEVKRLPMDAKVEISVIAAQG